MSERWFVIHVGDEGGEPWVLAETPDEAWAKDQAWSWNDAVVLSREEALVDPDFAPCVLEWEAKDDHRYAAWSAIEEAEGALSDAEVGAIIDGVIPRSAVEDSDSRTWWTWWIDSICSAMPGQEPDGERDFYDLFRRALFTAFAELGDSDEFRDLMRRVAVTAKQHAERDGHRVV